MCNIFLAMADIQNNAEWNVIEADDQQAIIGTLQKYSAPSRALPRRTWVVQESLRRMSSASVLHLVALHVESARANQLLGRTRTKREDGRQEAYMVRFERCKWARGLR